MRVAIFVGRQHESIHSLKFVLTLSPQRERRVSRVGRQAHLDPVIAARAQKQSIARVELCLRLFGLTNLVTPGSCRVARVPFLLETAVLS